ncbi:AraC family transcriptional regulator [Mumia sp. Pv 4-285]|uniref:AraC family transcriptional regulator n=1 Tax=Mumia qirimensis TaxID=3234852 RepID=UPI00351D0BAD
MVATGYDAQPVRTSEPVAALDELLGALHWSVTGFARDDLGAGDHRRYHGDGMRFHYVVSGDAVVSRGTERTELREGAFLLLPRGGEALLRSTTTTTLYTGNLRLEVSDGDRLVRLMPDTVLACCFRAAEPVMGPLLDAMDDEVRRARPGSSSLTTRIANLVMVAAIRQWAESGCGAASGWLGAIRDPHVARVLAAIHDDPGSPWTVASLAQVASASRSQFSEQFRAAVGDSPHRYLTAVRMRKAMDLLRTGTPSTYVASVTGYGSEAAFSRAFRRHTGLSPRAWRQAA